MQAWGPICILVILQFVTSDCMMKKEKLPEKCKLPLKKGKCGKMLERVYYDHNTKQCLNFIYGGCHGNKNNFNTLQDCLLKCKKFDFDFPVKNVVGNIDWTKFTLKKCKLRPQKGWCRSKVIQYYYDSILHRCRKFFYRGCGGNENRFTTYYDCVKECDVFDAIYKDILAIKQSSGALAMQNWGTICLIILLELTIPGCMEKVFMPRICKLPPQKGKCNADFENFYYDYKNNVCKTFIYGGCGGNKNNFVNLLECYYVCKRFGFFTTWENIVGNLQWQKKIPQECKLWAKKGKCKGEFPRYYYDAFNKRCRLFTYGGCGGNANNFRTFNDCNTACDLLGNTSKYFYPESTLQTCDQPLDVGPCKESFPRFYYDRNTKICKPFKFGGCNGNRNNFLSHEDCVQECKPV